MYKVADLHDVDGGDTGLDHGFGVGTRVRVDLWISFHSSFLRFVVCSCGMTRCRTPWVMCQTDTIEQGHADLSTRPIHVAPFSLSSIGIAGHPGHL